MNRLLGLLFLIHGYGCSQAYAATVEYFNNGISTTVKADTVTPANSKPLPVRILNNAGTVYDLATEATLQLVLTELEAANATLVLVQADTGDILTDTSAINGKLPALVSGRIPVDVGASVLPTGAATEATLSALNAKFGTLGQKNMAGSAPVVLATDQSAIPASQSGTWNITNITGTVSLPTGAATEATLAAQSAKLPATLGQKTSANSLAVVPASDYVPPTPAVPTAVTVKQAAITVGTSAVRLTTDASAPSSTRRRLNFMLDPASTATCYMGSSGVTSTSTTRGLIIFPGATQEYVDDANDYYLICSIAAQTVFVVEAE